MLRQPADEDPHALHLVQLLDAVLREDVHHPRREAAVGDDRLPLRGGRVVQHLLLEDDLGVAAEVAEVRPGLDGELREIEIEVVRDRAHHGVRVLHQREHGVAVADVDRRRDQPLPRVLVEELRQVVGVLVGEADFGHFGILEQIIGTGRALQAGPKDEHSHVREFSERQERTRVDC